MSSQMDSFELNLFRYRKPTEEQTQKMQKINEKVIELWQEVEALTHISADRTVARRQLQMFRALINQTIVFND